MAHEQDGWSRIGYCGDLGFIIGISPAPYLIVDQLGNRYMNEDLEAALNHAVYYDMIQFDTSTNTYPRNPSWWIFDQTRLNAGRSLTPVWAQWAWACMIGAWTTPLKSKRAGLSPRKP